MGESYAFTELLARLKASGEQWLEFIDRPTMRVGIYSLPAGGVDSQQPHDEDEIYYIVDGRRCCESPVVNTASCRAR